VGHALHKTGEEMKQFKEGKKEGTPLEEFLNDL